MMDFAQARANMIESQVRTNGVTDPRVIATMALVPREIFVPGPRRAFAYMDEDVEIVAASADGPARHLMEPMTFARLVHLLGLEATDEVLDVGCASGYSTAVLARIAARVTGLEANADLAAEARANLDRLGIGNAEIIVGEHAAGAVGRTFDAVLINGRIPEVPDRIAAWLKDGGRFAAVVGERDVGKAVLHTRAGSAISVRAAYDASVAPLPGFTVSRPGFTF
jgi:protein-L-isoaspartate(D-aspartate) O-methyltransferase